MDLNRAGFRKRFGYKCPYLFRVVLRVFIEISFPISGIIALQNNALTL